MLETAAPSTEEPTEDALLNGRVRLLQPRRGHRAGTDAVLLAGLAPVRPGDRVCDLGSASGAVGLMIAARRPDAELVFVDRDPALVELCRRNIALNGLVGRGRALAADVFSPMDAAGAGGLFDLVATNPPFFQGASRSSPDQGRRSARTMEGGGLAEWCAAASGLLKRGGRLALIHRADGLDLCLAALARDFGTISVVPIYPRTDEAATRIVISAVRGGRGPLTVAPPLVLHGQDGGFTPEAARLHSGEW